LHTQQQLFVDNNRPFSSYYAQEYNGFVPSTADKWVYMFGIAAIPPLLLNYFLTLLPAARTSSLLSIIGMSYEESMHFHKLTGFAAAFWAVVHGVLCQAPTANVPNGAKVSMGMRTHTYIIIN
jgi:Ferric reductase like transmembrane component